MINSVKSIIIAASALAMSVFAAMPSSAQEKVVRYEGSVSVGAGYFEYREVGGVLHTSHGIRFNREGVRFLYLGLSLEEQLYLGGRPYIPSYTFLSVHAKTYFPVGARVQATAAPPAYKAKLGKALIHNRIRAFFVSGRKQNIAFLRSLSGANSGSFFRDNKKAPEMYNTSLIIMFLRRIFLFLIF